MLPTRTETMPIYEFTCQDCGEDFEMIRRVSDSDKPACPVCRSHNTKKKMSGFVARSGGGNNVKSSAVKNSTTKSPFT